MIHCHFGGNNETLIVNKSERKAILKDVFDVAQTKTNEKIQFNGKDGKLHQNESSGSWK